VPGGCRPCSSACAKLLRPLHYSPPQAHPPVDPAASAPIAPAPTAWSCNRPSPLAVKHSLYSPSPVLAATPSNLVFAARCHPVFRTFSGEAQLVLPLAVAGEVEVALRGAVPLKHQLALRVLKLHSGGREAACAAVKKAQEGLKLALGVLKLQAGRQAGAPIRELQTRAGPAGPQTAQRDRDMFPLVNKSPNSRETSTAANQRPAPASSLQQTHGMHQCSSLQRTTPTHPRVDCDRLVGAVAVEGAEAAHDLQLEGQRTVFWHLQVASSWVACVRWRTTAWPAAGAAASHKGRCYCSPDHGSRGPPPLSPPPPSRSRPPSRTWFGTPAGRHHEQAFGGSQTWLSGAGSTSGHVGAGANGGQPPRQPPPCLPEQAQAGGLAVCPPTS